MKKLITVCAVALALAGSAGASAKDHRVSVCHLDDETGDFHVITVAQQAVPAHLAHGDFLFVDDEDEATEDCLVTEEPAV